MHYIFHDTGLLQGVLNSHKKKQIKIVNVKLTLQTNQGQKLTKNYNFRKVNF